MPFWRRDRDETPEPTQPEVIEPEQVEPGWEPDPADFEDPLPLVEPLTGRRARAGAASLTARRRAVEPCGPSRSAEPAGFDPTAFLAVAKPGSIDAGLERSRGGFMSQLRGYLGSADGPAWDEVEETLIAGDVGASLAIDVVERARKRRDPGGPEAAVRAELSALLVRRDLGWEPRSAVAGGPAVVLVVGVNGTGKTTTIGKLATRYAAEGRSIILAAADTFRAAAIDQLRIWADRSKVPIDRARSRRGPGCRRL